MKSPKSQTVSRQIERDGNLESQAIPSYPSLSLSTLMGQIGGRIDLVDGRSVQVFSQEVNGDTDPMKNVTLG